MLHNIIYNIVLFDGNHYYCYILSVNVITDGLPSQMSVMKIVSPQTVKRKSSFNCSRSVL